jgi:hypothetical protein
MDFKLSFDSYLESDIKVDTIKFQKMLFIYNVLEEGWCIKKRNGAYVFTKNHENKKEILDDSYLMKFMKTNLDVSKLIQS